MNILKFVFHDKSALADGLPDRSKGDRSCRG